MHWPQVAMLVLLGLSLGISATTHGQEKKSVESFPAVLFGNGVLMIILYCGGFFTK